jgi:hypothetical protein
MLRLNMAYLGAGLIPPNVNQAPLQYPVLARTRSAATSLPLPGAFILVLNKGWNYHISAASFRRAGFCEHRSVPAGGVTVGRPFFWREKKSDSPRRAKLGVSDKLYIGNIDRAGNGATLIPVRSSSINQQTLPFGKTILHEFNQFNLPDCPHIPINLNRLSTEWRHGREVCTKSI